MSYQIKYSRHLFVYGKCCLNTLAATAIKAIDIIMRRTIIKS